MHNDPVPKTDLQFALDAAVQTNIITGIGVRFDEANQQPDQIKAALIHQR